MEKEMKEDSAQAGSLRCERSLEGSSHQESEHELEYPACQRSQSSDYIELHDSIECESTVDSKFGLRTPAPGIKSFPSGFSASGLQKTQLIGAGDEAGNQAMHIISSDLCRLARFGLNIADAHSCFIFLPGEVLITLSGGAVLSSGTTAFGMREVPAFARSLIMAGFHSLSDSVQPQCVLPKGSGLIGWVAAHHRSIHVSPFELDSRTLGIYTTDHQLKSFLGIPIPLHSCLFPQSSPQVAAHEAAQRTQQAAGVIACDSKKSFAFSKLQGKLLEELAAEIGSCLSLHVRGLESQTSDGSWNTFLRRCDELIAALGTGSVQMLRLRFANFENLERSIGLGPVLSMADQVLRLFKQSLPPHFPLTRLHNGDILVCVDSMMSSFYENKFTAICEHIAPPGKRPLFEVSRATFRDKRRKVSTVEGLIALTADAVEGERQTGLGQVFHLTKSIVNGFSRS